MSKYTSKTVNVPRTVDFINNKFSDLTQLEEMVKNLPEEQRNKVGDLSFEKQAIVMNTPQVGQLRFAVVENTPSLIAMEAVGSPVPLKLLVDLVDKGNNSTDITTSVDINIPMMLKPIIGPQLQKMVDGMGSFITTLAQ